MAKKISEKELERIVAESASLALKKLSILSESKETKKVSEKMIDEAVEKSLKAVLSKQSKENQ